MQLSGRPLLDNAADQALFVNRDAELRRIDRSLRSGLNCLLIGEPGSGKTSLVRALMYRSHESGDALRFSYVRANNTRTAVELLTAIFAATGTYGAGGDTTEPTVVGLNVPSPKAQTLPARQGDSADQSPIDLVAELARRVAATATEVPHVIVVEDVGAAAASELFGALRDELWQVDARWLVTASTAQAPSLLRPPADVFFETRVELTPLTTQEAADLLRRRLDDDEFAANRSLVEAAADSGSQTPRRLLELARELAAEPAVGGRRFTTVSGLKARTAALEQASRPARMLAQELEALGWSSASDERLLARVGWTRPRVVQVIGELESRGLVQMREENSGRGRPRKLYRLVPGAQFQATPEAGLPQVGSTSEVGLPREGSPHGESSPPIESTPRPGPPALPDAGSS